MSSILDPATIEQAFQGHDDDKIIARPGEAIVNIDARTARRKVSGYVAREVSMMMGGVEPALIYSEGRLIWRVPIIFTTPSDGPLGVVGAIDVDTRTAEILVSKHLYKTLRTNAKALLDNSSHPSAI